MSLTPGSKPEWSLSEISSDNPEYDLFDSVICEYIDIAGIPVQYYIKIHKNTDSLYGESTIEEMEGPFDTKVIYNIQGEQTILNAFGLSSDETIDSMYITKTIFARDIKDDYYPVPGDVIRTKWNDKLYEIVNISYETKVFELKKYVMEFIMKPYRHNESIDNTFIEGDLNNIGEFPDINLDRNLTLPLSAGSDNDYIEKIEKEEQKYSDLDSRMYGYDDI